MLFADIIAWLFLFVGSMFVAYLFDGAWYAVIHKTSARRARRHIREKIRSVAQHIQWIIELVPRIVFHAIRYVFLARNQRQAPPRMIITIETEPGPCFLCHEVRHDPGCPEVNPVDVELYKLGLSHGRHGVKDPLFGGKEAYDLGVRIGESFNHGVDRPS